MSYRFIFLIIVSYLLSQLSLLIFAYRSIIVYWLSPNAMMYYRPVLESLLYVSGFIAVAIVLYLAKRFGLLNDYRNLCRIKHVAFLVTLSLLLLMVNKLVAVFLWTYFPHHINTNQENIAYLYHSLPRLFFYWSITVGAGVFEEVIYRACIFKIIKSPRLALICSVLLFAFAHTQTISVLAYLPTGILLGSYYKKTDSLSDCISIHICHNILSLLV
ncbi:CPBP family intramembrane glutamic endopeptidase [Streptococcus fryi]